MRRPIIRRGVNAQIGTMRLVRVLELRLEVERAALDAALDFGLDLLAKNATVKIIRLVREIQEKGGHYGTSIRNL